MQKFIYHLVNSLFFSRSLDLSSKNISKLAFILCFFFVYYNFFCIIKLFCCCYNCIIHQINTIFSFCFAFQMSQLMSSKQKQKERIVAQFINFTQANEKNAINFLNQHDWKLDLAVDAYYLSLDSGPRRDSTRANNLVDRKKLDQIWGLYRGRVKSIVYFDLLE